ncbi:MAG: hypothetical protein K8R57_01090 [Verrucomicrobia bacterium]|nr:hypothetical protein [Verrucomicrobiota bacterium]
MKHTKSILMAAVAALSIASASAQSVIYVTGATAFRKAANKNLYALFGDKLYASSGAATNTDSAVGLYFTNCVLSNNAVVDIAVTWTGSEGGIQQVASGTNNKRVPYFDKAKIETVLGTNTTMAQRLGLTPPDTTSFAIGTYTTLQKGLVGFMDTYPGSSRFKPNVKASDGIAYKDLSLTQIGVVPYTYIASKGFASAFPQRDITTGNAQQLLESGSLTGNLITGNDADYDTIVWSMGRNIDSGSRVINHAVNKYGTLTTVLQWKVTASGGNVTMIEKHPATTLLGIGVALGNNGESTGSAMCGFMTNSIPSGFANVVSDTGEVAGSTGNFLIGYSSVADTLPFVVNGLVPLKYNGVEGRCYSQTNATTLDAGYTNIITGKYPYWGYEFIGYDATLTGNANVPVLVNQLATRIKSLTATNGDLAPNIPIGDMKVLRSEDGGKQIYNY